MNLGEALREFYDPIRALDGRKASDEADYEPLRR